MNRAFPGVFGSTTSQENTLKAVVSLAFDTHLEVPIEDLSKFLVAISGLRRVKRTFSETSLTYEYIDGPPPNVAIVNHIQEKA